MKVYVKLFATLVRSVSLSVSERYPEGIRSGTRLEVELPADCSVDELMNHLGLPKEQVKIIFVNGRARERAYRLEPEDEVGIFPPVGGG